MSRNRVSIFFLLLPLLLISQRGFAQQFCADATDETQCEDNVNKVLLKDVALAPELKGDKARAAIQALQEQTTDKTARELLSKVFPEIAALPGASAAFEDFLNRLRIGVTTEGTDKMPALALDFTNFLGLSTKDGYKVQAVARDPLLDEGLSKQLSQENRDKRTKGLGSFDDVLVTFAYSPSTLHLGNNLGANQLLIDDLFRRFLAQDEALAAKATEAKTARKNLARELPAEAFSPATGLVQFDKITDPERKRQFREAVEQAAVAEANRLSSVFKTLNSASFFKIADLVANQPQLVVKAMRTVRDEFVGPEETTLKVSYEQGFVNMNGLRRALAACKPEAITTCYTSYLTGRRAQLAKAQNRLTFSLDWTQRQDYRPTVDGVSLDRPGKDRRTAVATFGRNLRVDVNGEFTSRFDLTTSWEDWSDDPLHQDRGLASLSFTQKVTTDMSLVLGAVWASKPQFRGQVDKEVSARFGLTYRFLDAKGKEIMRGH